MIERAQAVERLTAMLDADRISVEQFNALVEEVLAAGTPDAIAAVLAVVDAPAPPPPLEIVCDGDMKREAPAHLPPVVEIRCEAGVVRIDLSAASRESEDTDVEIEMVAGVLNVVVPRDVDVRLGEHDGNGGVLRNRLRPPLAEGLPRIHMHVRNEGGIVTLSHRRRWLPWRR